MASIIVHFNNINNHDKYDTVEIEDNTLQSALTEYNRIYCKKLEKVYNMFGQEIPLSYNIFTTEYDVYVQ